MCRVRRAKPSWIVEERPNGVRADHHIDRREQEERDSPHPHGSKIDERPVLRSSPPCIRPCPRALLELRVRRERPPNSVRLDAGKVQIVGAPLALNERFVQIEQIHLLEEEMTEGENRDQTRGSSNQAAERRGVRVEGDRQEESLGSDSKAWNRPRETVSLRSPTLDDVESPQLPCVRLRRPSHRREV